MGSRVSGVNSADHLRRLRVEMADAHAGDAEFRQLTSEWMAASCPRQYSYRFDWLGRPVIQYPQDVVALQEILWEVRPEAVVECGIAYGGSLVLTASILALIDYCDAAESGDLGRLADRPSRVVGVDIDIRDHNRVALDNHPLRHKIRLVEGSSTEPDVVAQVHAEVDGRSPVLVLLDSDHTATHVRGELAAYAHLTTVGSYCVVYDTVIEHLPADLHDDRPWGPGNSPATAVAEFVEENPHFEVDRRMDEKLAITVAPGGYLRRVS